MKTIHLPDKLHAKLKKLAQEQNRTLIGTLETLLSTPLTKVVKN